MIETIFRDNDGVLVDTEGLFFRANQETLAAVGIALRWEKFEEISLVSRKGMLWLAADPGAVADGGLTAESNAIIHRTTLGI